MIHYHGTPITPRRVLQELAGHNFCVSFSAPGDLAECHRIGQTVMLDNGAYNAWKQGGTPDWEAWAEWVEPWLDYPTTWAVLPDVIDGDETDNDRLLAEYAWLTSATAPVWHLHESITRLQRLCDTYSRVCFGSSGVYSTVGTEPWRRRVTEAFDAIASPAGRVPWIHMLRGMSMSGDVFPFASVDSTDVARNHHLKRNHVRMAKQWDALQPPGRWVTHRQEKLVVL